jgi:hypothetical protein
VAVLDLQVGLPIKVGGLDVAQALAGNIGCWVLGGIAKLRVS